MNQLNSGSAQARDLGQQNPHLPRTSIGHHPGLINGLMGGPSGHQQMLSLPITISNGTFLSPAEQGCRSQFDQRWIRHPAIPEAIASQ
jgi:hypothetical protein